MSPSLLADLALLWSLESVDADMRGDPDEAVRLADEARQIRERADHPRRRLAMTLHAVVMTTARR